MIVTLRKRYEDSFFKNIATVGRIFKYSESEYLYKDVKKIAKKYGFETTYEPPGTVTYETYGCFNFKIIGHVDEEPRTEIKDTPLFFDINELV